VLRVQQDQQVHKALLVLKVLLLHKVHKVAQD
jgi:hypothetical protein